MLNLAGKSNVLIVPYGIETYFIFLPSKVIGVLIVPYGIETRVLIFLSKGYPVLIVPYGIETPVLNNSLRPLKCVNCTLWN